MGGCTLSRLAGACADPQASKRVFTMYGRCFIRLGEQSVELVLEGTPRQSVESEGGRLLRFFLAAVRSGRRACPGLYLHARHDPCRAWSDLGRGADPCEPAARLGLAPSESNQDPGSPDRLRLHRLRRQACAVGPLSSAPT